MKNEGASSDAGQFRPRVVLLKPGFLLRNEEGEILDARSSVTLIVSGSKNIVVDTGQADEGETIRDRLALQRLNFEDVDLVINTHSHQDHCGNNHLFTRARVLSLEKGNVKEGDFVAQGVWIMETPGHTLDSISVVCECSSIVVMAGDALPIMGNYLKWVPPRLHVDRDLALESMSRIVHYADIIVPGHDRPFSLKKKRYITDIG
jgi:N-acyl homoserine lactone hydrolase